MANTQLGKFWLALPWLILALGVPTLIWWLAEPVPVTITYTAPAFLSSPVTERPSPKLYAHEAPGGSTLYRWVEYCVSKPFNATVHRSWVGKAIVWPAPDLPTRLSREVGCRGASIVVEVPTSNPSRSFEFVQTMTIELNPLRTEMIEYPPIPLHILAPADCKKQ